MSLIVLCRRVGVEMSELILRTFFSALRMNNRTFSLRPRSNVVTLFDAIPSKVIDWRDKWLYVECNTGFPFPPLSMDLAAWRPVGKREVHSEDDKRFLEFVAKELGDDPKKQTKVFLTQELLSPQSLSWCGIGGPSEEVRKKTLGLEDAGEYPAWRLHPHRVFYDDCVICNSPNSAGCPTNAAMNFQERQKAKYAARKKALASAQHNPPAAVPRGAHSETPSIPRSTITSAPRSHISPKKRGPEEDSNRDGADSRAKKSRVEYTPSGKTVEGSKREEVRGRDKGKGIAISEPTRSTSTRVAPSWKREGFQLPVTQAGLKDLATEIGQSVPTLTGLELSNPRVGRYLGQAVWERCLDSDTFSSIALMGSAESLGLAGALLSQVAAHTKHMANIAASAETSRKMVVDLEKKVNDKDTDILSLKDSVRTAEEKLHQASELEKLTAAKLQIADVKCSDYSARLREEKKKYNALSEKSFAEKKELAEKVAYYESQEYTEKVVRLFQESEVYKNELFEKSIAFYERGAAHVYRQFHHLIPDKRQMWKVFEGAYTEKQFRGGADFIPYSDEELREIRQLDAQAGEEWAMPPPVHPNFFEMCDQFREEVEELPDIPGVSVEPASTITAQGATNTSNDAPAVSEHPQVPAPSITDSTIE